MKVLYILRHAKSSWDDASLADFDRPLNERGLRAAPLMAAFLLEKGPVPDLIVSSPARRAEQTSDLVKEVLGSNIPIEYDERIYEASPRTLLSVITGISDEYGSALLVGHNPGLEGLIGLLSGEIAEMPTAALARIEMEIGSWQDAGASAGNLAFVARPKELLKMKR